MTTETTEADWPFDAYQDDPLAALRIPVVSSPYPGWKYEVALCCPNSEAGQDLYPSLRPDETETAMIAAYIQYRLEYYNEGWRARMRQRPLDVDSGTNTVILRKRAEGDWCYRRMTWTTGPVMVPPWDAEEKLDLPRLLDRINDICGEPYPRWTEFKAAHPEAFPVAADVTLTRKEGT